MNLQQLQQQIRELAPAIAYVVTQGNPYSANSFSLTMDGLRGVLLAGATAEAVLEQVRDLEFVRRFGQGESVQSITQGEDPLEF
jgi:hypothetical protein